METLSRLREASNGSVKAGDRVDALDGNVGAVADRRARVDELAPDVSALLGTLRSQSQIDPRRIGRAVDALHRRDHAELTESRDVR